MNMMVVVASAFAFVVAGLLTWAGFGYLAVFVLVITAIYLLVNQPTALNGGSLKKNWEWIFHVVMLGLVWHFKPDGELGYAFVGVVILLILIDKWGNLPKAIRSWIKLIPIALLVISVLMPEGRHKISTKAVPWVKEKTLGTQTVICEYVMVDMDEAKLDSVRVNGEDGMACELAPGVWRMEVMNNSHYRYLHANKVDYMDASLKKGGHDVHESELSLLPYNKENGWNGALLASVDGSYWQPSGNVLTVASLSTVQVQLNIVPGTAQGGIVGSVPITFLFTSQQ